jgi:hypothetical protein
MAGTRAPRPDERYDEDARASPILQAVALARTGRWMADHRHMQLGAAQGEGLAPQGRRWPVGDRKIVPFHARAGTIGDGFGLHRRARKSPCATRSCI